MRVYIAGAITAPTPIQFLENVRRGIRLSAEALLAGFSVFSPFIDFQIFLGLQGNEQISATTIRASSIDWLIASHAVLLVPGWEGSHGTKAELDIARIYEIPVFHSLQDLKRWVIENGQPEKPAAETMQRQAEV